MTRFYVTAGSQRPSAGVTVLREPGNLITGVNDFVSSFGDQPISLEADLMRIAALLFAADRGSPRGMREDVVPPTPISD